MDGTFKQVVIVSVGMTKFHSDQFMPFEIDDVSLELFRDHSLSGIWSGNAALQISSRASGDAFWRITFTALGVATALAFGNRSRECRRQTNGLHDHV